MRGGSWIVVLAFADGPTTVTTDRTTTQNPGISLGGIKREYEKDGFSRVWRVGLWWHRGRIIAKLAVISAN